jgi:hypothetical protein
MKIFIASRKENMNLARGMPPHAQGMQLINKTSMRHSMVPFNKFAKLGTNNICQIYLSNSSF